MGYAVEARELRKSFRGRPAVAGVDLAIRPGERVALLGPNGAGKTTTLLMLLGVVTPDHGGIQVFGHALPQARRQALAMVGFAAGYLPLPDRLRVREILGVFAGLFGVKNGPAAIRESLDRFGAGHLADRMGRDLSSGQRTLVAMAKAVLHRPRLLVLDEPTASLDPSTAAGARKGLAELARQEGTTLLVTSHNMTEVERICERVVLLSQGRVAAEGSPSDVAATFGQPDLEHVFLHLSERSA